MDASPSSQSRKGMGFRSWHCGSCGTCGDRPAVYFSGEPFFPPYPNHPLSIYRGLNMWHTSNRCAMKFISVWLLSKDFVQTDSNLHRESVLGDKTHRISPKRFSLVYFDALRGWISM